VSTDTALADEFDEYLAEALKSPSFRIAYEAAQARCEACHPRSLAIDGREYRRRQKARKRRR
jgi:hypothetical protein